MGGAQNPMRGAQGKKRGAQRARERVKPTGLPVFGAGPPPLPPGIELELSKAGFSLIEWGWSALERFFRPRSGPPPWSEYRRFCMTDAGQADVAKLAEGIEYPGYEYADAALRGETPETYALCDVDLKRPPRSHWRQADFYYDRKRTVFLDPYGVYPALRESALEPDFPVNDPWPAEALFQAAALCSRFGFDAPSPREGYRSRNDAPGWQRDLLCLVLGGAYPWKALSLLREAGFIKREWPEAAQLFDLEQSKEFHPEGDAWEHTLETFKYRKDPDLILSLALFLHDTGKPLSESAQGRRFDRHAELGAQAARRLLERLGFDARTRDDVCFLVRQHMLPAALPRLPLFRAREALESPLFPKLLELYRCDSSSTFMGPGGYYEACAAFSRYRRNLRNPYREADGTIMKGGKRSG
jgi:poly(A) polymerase